LPQLLEINDPKPALDVADREGLADCLEAVAQNGDREAFGRLFAVFAPRVKSYLMRQGVPAPAAEDLAQDVMLTVWRKAASFDRNLAGVSTWIFTIARNRRIDVIRRERRPEFDPEDPAFQPEPEKAADEVMTIAQRDDRLRAAIKDLPPEQIALLQDAFYTDKSHREIAEDTGLPLGTVKSRLRLAFARLRKVMEDPS